MPVCPALPRTIILSAVFVIAIAGAVHAGDPQVRAFVGAPLTVQVGDTVRFIVEMVNPFAFPASNFQSRFQITPLADTSQTERFDLPPIVFPPMGTVNVSMAPQFWIAKTPGMHRVYFQSYSPDDINPQNNFIEHDFLVEPPLLDQPRVQYILNAYLHSAPVAAMHLMGVRFVDGMTRIRSRWTAELDTTVAGPSAVAWVVGNIHERYHGTDRVLILDRGDSTKLSDRHISYDPLIGDSSLVGPNGTFFAANVISGALPQVQQVATLEHISSPDSGSALGRALAVLVSGEPRGEWSYDESFIGDMYRMQQEILLESLGPRLLPDGVTILHAPTPQEVSTQIRSAKGKYGSIYYFYSGFGSMDGMHLAGEYTYDDFIDDLAHAEADSINIYLDVPHGGVFRDLIDASRNRFRKTAITAVTSTDTDTRSTWCEYTAGSGDTLSLGTFTYEFARAFGNPLADVDGIPGTTFAETYNYLQQTDPLLPWSGEALFDVMRPQLYVKPVDSLALLLDRQATELFLEEYIRIQGAADPSRSLLFLPQFPSHGVSMNGPAASGISISLDSLHWPAVLVHDKYALPGGLMSYYLLDRRDASITHWDADWFPRIDGVEYPAAGVQAENDIVFGTQRMPDRVASFHTIDTEASVPSTNTRSAAVVYGSGGGSRIRHGRLTEVPAAITVISDLSMEKLGSRAVDDLLRVLTAAPPAVVRDSLRTLRGRVDMLSAVYFGGGRGTSLEGSSTYPHRDIISDLSEIGAERLEMIIDAPFSGNAIADVLELIQPLNQKQLTLITSSGPGYRAYEEFMKDDAGDTLAIPSFTWQFLQSYGHPDADIDGIPGTSFAETFYHLNGRAPKFLWSDARLFDVQRPEILIRGRTAIDANETSIPDAGITLRFGTPPNPGSMLDYMQRRVTKPVTNDTTVIYISPSRMWTFVLNGHTGALSTDISFRYLPGFDSAAPPPHARLGIVHREDDTSGVAMFQRWRQTIWDREHGILTARGVDGFSDWALAYVRNSAPQEFLRQSPPDDAVVFEDSVPLLWNRSMDPDGDSLRYLLDVTANGSTRNWVIPDTAWVVSRTDLGLPAGSYPVTWSVRSTDGTDTTLAANGEGRFLFDISTGAEDAPARPEFLRILGHHPEPFAGAVRLDLALHVPAYLRVSIHSLTGARIAMVTEGFFVAGMHALEWNGTSSSGAALPSGVYVAVVETPGHAPVMRRLTLLR